MGADLDAVRDGLAMIEAVHRRDGEAYQVLLDHCEQQLTLRFLVTLAENLIGDLAAWNRLEPADVLARLREWGAGHD